MAPFRTEKQQHAWLRGGRLVGSVGCLERSPTSRWLEGGGESGIFGLPHVRAKNNIYSWPNRFPKSWLLDAELPDEMLHSCHAIFRHDQLLNKLSQKSSTSTPFCHFCTVCIFYSISPSFLAKNRHCLRPIAWKVDCTNIFFNSLFKKYRFKHFLPNYHTSCCA